MTVTHVYELLHNDRRIYEQPDGSCVISECSCWIPGIYASLEAARAAFDLTPEKQAQLAKDAGGEHITLDKVLTIYGRISRCRHVWVPGVLCILDSPAASTKQRCRLRQGHSGDCDFGFDMSEHRRAVARTEKVRDTCAENLVGVKPMVRLPFFCCELPGGCGIVDENAFMLVSLNVAKDIVDQWRDLKISETFHHPDLGPCSLLRLEVQEGFGGSASRLTVFAKKIGSKP